jgi:transposase InsO family protein
MTLAYCLIHLGPSRWLGPSVQIFFSVADARDKLELWRQDYNRVRPHSALGDSAPEEFASAWQTARVSVELLEASNCRKYRR